MPVLLNVKVSGALVMFNDRLETQKAGPNQLLSTRQLTKRTKLTNGMSNNYVFYFVK